MMPRREFRSPITEPTATSTVDSASEPRVVLLNTRSIMFLPAISVVSKMFSM